jgi:hypothetical protein
VKNILLVEPDYRSKFPPLGLLKLAAYHKERGDSVTFVRGRDEAIRSLHWHRIYVASLFTWELPRTVETIKYYASSVSSSAHIIVGGVGATLLPDYIRNNASCTVIEGALDTRGLLGPNSRPVAEMVPDYCILDMVEYDYQPRNAYFVRITKGCIRSCTFCAVPTLEREFGRLTQIDVQVGNVNRKYGERQNLIVMDNNILGIEGIENEIAGIGRMGFERGAKRNGRERYVDFNQGLDARLISEKPELARHLGTICLSPVRLAFDFITAAMEKAYRRAIELLAGQGFDEFTNYMLFNFNDSPKDLYHRLFVNAELNRKLGIRITGFPMRFIPMSDVKRGHVSDKWRWRYLRGLQCVLLATRGLVSPNLDFVRAAFGATYEEFLEILAMPDRYIIYRKEYKTNGASEWRREYRRLTESRREEFLVLLAALNKDRNRRETIRGLRNFRSLLEHYYPNGETPRAEVGQEKEGDQRMTRRSTTLQFRRAPLPLVSFVG